MRSRKLWLSLSVLAMLVALVACARATPTPTPVATPRATPTAIPAATPVATATPTPTSTPRKPEGTLVVALEDIGSAAGLPSRVSGGNIHMISFTSDYLIHKDRQGKFIPNLAERWELSPDGRTFTVYLRKGIPFHDGWGEVTAEDVKFSYLDAIKEGSVSIRVGQMKKYMESIDTPDPYTVVFRLTKGSAVDFPNQLTNVPMPALPIVSKKYVEAVGVEKAAEHPIGTGPWRFVEFRVGDYAKYEAVENHWRQPPYFKTLIVKAVPEPATRVFMLRAGELDLFAAPVAFKKEVEKAGFRVMAAPGGYHSYVAFAGLFLPTRPEFDPKIPWVGDPKDPASMERALKVRKAMNLAVNKQEIADTVLEGIGQVVAASGFFPGTVFPDPAWRPIPYDPDEAKKLLREAGYPDGFKILMTYFEMGGAPWLPDVGEAVAMFWEKIGLTVERRRTDFTTWRPENVARAVKGAYTIRGGFYPEPWTWWMTQSHSTTDVMTGAEQPYIDEFLEKIGAEVDFDKRLQLQRRLGDYFRDNYLTVPLAAMPGLYALSQKVGEWPTPVGMTYLTATEYVTRAK